MFVILIKRFIFALAICNGLVVQLVRMSPCHGEGRGFESRPDRKIAKSFNIVGAFFSKKFSCVVLMDVVVHQTGRELVK